MHAGRLRLPVQGMSRQAHTCVTVQETGGLRALEAGRRFFLRGVPMTVIRSIDELASRLADLMPPGMREAREDLTSNLRSVLVGGLRQLDLVTREEFDVQRCVLLRTREKLEALERQIATLEAALLAPGQTATH
jgi:ubiquinone biosynthesis accessory factor UbiK